MFPVSAYSAECPPVTQGIDDYRRRRLLANRRLVLNMLTEALSTVAGLVVLGEDPLVRHFVERTGTAPQDVVICEVIIGERPETIVAVPKKIWFRPDRMERLQRARRKLANVGRRFTVIPMTAFEALPRDVAGCILAEAIRATVVLEETCASRSRHDPAGCHAHRLATGRGCTP